tara:strand:+ start:2060 stop:2542 length:483 start_codon:yes stop_codon:yes gene_type:complete
MLVLTFLIMKGNDMNIQPMLNGDVEFKEDFVFEEFQDHKEIPVPYRRYLLDYTSERRIKNIPIEICNELIQDFIQDNTVNEALKNFELTYRLTPNSPLELSTFNNIRSALDALDDLVSFETSTSVVVAMLKQNGRVVRGLWKGQEVFPRSMYHTEPPAIY